MAFPVIEPMKNAVIVFTISIAFERSFGLLPKNTPMRQIM
jgi:hypothetical protein